MLRHWIWLLPALLMIIPACKRSTPLPAEASQRIEAARKHSETRIRTRFADAGVSYPASRLFLRAFKHTQILELWASSSPSEPLRKIATFPLLAQSGSIGPKKREGDRQIPEGLYSIAVLNPLSSYHLSLGLNYPTPRDLRHADPAAPGSDIYIHGGARSIGCLAIGDDAIEELFLAVSDATSTSASPLTADPFFIPVHIFPAPMHGSAWEQLAAEHTARDPALAPFWAELEHHYTSFEATHRISQQ